MNEPKGPAVGAGYNIRPVVLAILIATSVAWGEPRLEQHDLFEAGRDGYRIFRIPGLIVTAKGTILAYCEARRTGSDWGKIDILLRRSTDGGVTWSAPNRVADMPDGARRNKAAPKQPFAGGAGITLNNPVAIARIGMARFICCTAWSTRAASIAAATTTD